MLLVERLGDVEVEARFAGVAAVFFLAVAGNGDEVGAGELGHAAQRAADLVAVHVADRPMSHRTTSGMNSMALARPVGPSMAVGHVVPFHLQQSVERQDGVAAVVDDAARAATRAGSDCAAAAASLAAARLARQA